MGAFLLLVALSVGAAPSASPSTGASRKVESAVLSQVAAKGQATFWVRFHDRADLSGAYAIKNWNARGQYVVDRLRAVADRSQKGVQAFLTGRGVKYQSFWAVNTILVTAGRSVVDALAARADVSGLRAQRTYQIPQTTVSASSASPNAIEWNIDRINAPDVWAQFNDRGKGIVVANIDTGVQWNHAALVKQYRGTKPAGGVNHNYNWWDPSNICAGDVPCDNFFHGTHTMGTMVGDDGGANQIGVAPKAKWIAAKGCESNSCSDFALLSSGQWVLAPTNLQGQNPKVAKRPNVVNNSWGSTNGADDFYRDVVTDWVAAGIFPSFSNGNSGPGCNTVGSPASYPESYGAGAFDINNVIASFSSRGTSPFGGITKPNVSAPGVNVRSSLNNGGYGLASGTSMAAPHVSGTVALIWSEVPGLKGDIAGTRAAIDSTAIDTAGPCGGAAANNNTWGQGRLDAFAAVSNAIAMAG